MPAVAVAVSHAVRRFVVAPDRRSAGIVARIRGSPFKLAETAAAAPALLAARISFRFADEMPIGFSEPFRAILPFFSASLVVIFVERPRLI